MTIRNLDRAFLPKSVALIGASAREGSLGTTVMKNLCCGSFSGEIWPVNPKYETVQGRPCFRSVADLPSAPDLAVVVIPAPKIPGVIAELGNNGTHAAVVISGGLSADSRLKQAMLDAARPTTLRIIGPNCIGILLPNLGLNASFAHLLPEPGKLAFISQSGAIVGAMVDWAAASGVGFSHVVSMGDAADIDSGDLLDYLARDRTTHAILMYLETVTNPKKFMTAARSAARSKPVIVVKAGRHAQAAAAAATHTGALSGSDLVMSAALRRAGVIRVETLRELFIAAEVLTNLKPIESDRLAILTNGGGAGVLAIDKLMDLDGTPATLNAPTIQRLNKQLPAMWSRSNPIDIIGDADAARYEAALEAVLDDDNVDAALVIHCPTALTKPQDAADAVVKVVEKRRSQTTRYKPVFTNWLGNPAVASSRRTFDTARIPTFETPGHAITAFRYLCDYTRAQNSLMRTPASLPNDFKVDRAAARNVMRGAAQEGRKILTEPEAKAVLIAYGINTVTTETVTTIENVATAAQHILDDGSHVAIKILSKDISHKSDVGGVTLNLKTSASATEAAQAMLHRVSRHQPEAKIDGFTVQPMVQTTGRHELILGVSHDKIFGPTLLFGAGGTAVEVIRDQAIGLPPLDLMLANDMIQQTRIYKLLRGYRNEPAANLDAIALTLVRLSQLVVDCAEISALDINPLLVDENGVIALDARIEIDPSNSIVQALNPNLVITPYPSEWERQVTTSSGDSISIRPIRPTDEPLYDAFVTKLDAEDVRMRLFSPRKELSHRFAARLTQIDYAREMAFIARNDEGELCGVARLSAEPNHESAEFAVMIRSDLKTRGYGWALMQQLIEYAKADHISFLLADILRENTKMVKLVQALGFKTFTNPEDVSLVMAELSLANVTTGTSTYVAVDSSQGHTPRKSIHSS